jgi:hypothetical protein
MFKMCDNLLSKSYSKTREIDNSNIETWLLKNVPRCKSLINLSETESIESKTIIFWEQNLEVNTENRIRLWNFSMYYKKEKTTNHLILWWIVPKVPYLVQTIRLIIERKTQGARINEKLN